MAKTRITITEVVAKYPTRTVSLGNNFTDIDWDIEHEVTVECLDENWTVTVKEIKDSNGDATPDQNEVVVTKVDNTKFTIKGTLDKSECVVEITAQADGDEANTLRSLVGVNLIPTNLTANYTLLNVNDGESLTPGKKLKLDVTTNADDYITYSSDSDIIKPVITDGVVDKNQFEAVNKGRCIVTVEARKRGSVLVIKSFTVEVARTKSNIDGTYTTTLQLFNSISSRSITIQHNTKELTEDVTLTLPTKSGSLLSQEDPDIPDNEIDTPFIVEPSNMTKNYLGLFTDSKYYTTSTDTTMMHYYESEWQVAFDPGFEKIQYTRTVERTFQDFATIQVEPINLHFAGIGVWYIRVRHNTKDRFDVKSSSKWSPTIIVQFGTDYDIDHELPSEPIWHYNDANDSVVVPEIEGMKNYWYFSYYGVIPINEENCVNDYNYRGTFQTIIDNFNPEYYGDANAPWDRYMMVTFKKGWQVIHPKTVRVNGKNQQVDTLWYALQDVDCRNAKTDPSVVPGGAGSEANWAEDTRDKLPTPYQLVRRVGMIPAPCTHGDFVHAHTVMVGNIQETGHYIKYTWNGKLCFTTLQPTIRGVGWNTCVMRLVALGDRTFRFGKKLYRVRLMTSEEYLAMFGALTSRRIPGVYYNPVTDLELDKPSQIAHEYNVSRTDNRWTYNIYYNIYDTATNQIICNNYQESKKGVNITGRVNAVNNELIHCRLVLEYVPEDQAVYNNIDLMFPNLIKPKSNKLVYDKYSDSGFLGVLVKSADDDENKTNFITSDDLYTVTGSAGTKYEIMKWYVFYWNSMIVYLADSSLSASGLTKAKIRYLANFRTTNDYVESVGELNKNGQLYCYCMLPLFGQAFVHAKFPESVPGNYPKAYWPICLLNNFDVESMAGGFAGELIHRILEGYIGYDDPKKYDDPRIFRDIQRGDNFDHPDLKQYPATWTSFNLSTESNGVLSSKSGFDHNDLSVLFNNNAVWSGAPAYAAIYWHQNCYYWWNGWSDSGTNRFPLVAYNKYNKFNNMPLKLLYTHEDYPVLRFDILNPEKRPLMFRVSKTGTLYQEARIPVTSLEWYKIYNKIMENMKLFGFKVKETNIAYRYQTDGTGSASAPLGNDARWLTGNIDFFEVCDETNKNYNGDKYVRNTLEWVRNANVKVDVLFRQTAVEYDTYTKNQNNKATLTENTMSLVRTPTEIMYYIMKDLLPYSVWANYNQDEWSTKFADETYKNEFITKLEITEDEINYKEDKYNTNYLRYRYTLDTDDFDEWVDLATRYLIDAAYSYQRVITQGKGTTTTETVRIVNGEEVTSTVQTDLVQPNTTYAKHLFNLWFNKFLIVDEAKK